MPLISLRTIAFSALFAVALGGCSESSDESFSGQQPGTVVFDKAQITVIGEADGVERFSNLQRSRKLPLTADASRQLDDGRIEATFVFPDGTTSNDLVQTTREALAAGLDYSTTHTTSETTK